MTSGSDASTGGVAPAGASLAGRTAVVTAGAGTGIGFATASLLAREGAQVLLSDRHERRLAEYAARLSQECGRPVPSVVCDVTDEQQVQALFETAVRELGAVDILVNNAGLGGTHEAGEITDDVWQRILDVTLTSVMRCTRAVLPHMTARGRGAIVNIGSAVVWRGERGQAAYAAAKAGVLAYTRCAAVDVAAKGVRINAVVPTTTMHANLARVTTQEYLDELAAQLPMGRAANPDEIARVILFLASDLSGYMTGEAVSVGCLHA